MSVAYLEEPSKEEEIIVDPTKKVFVIFLFAIVFCTCSSKKIEVTRGQEKIIDAQEKSLSIIQKAIKVYEPTMAYLFQVEGNFTNSGYKEVMAFYQSKGTLIIEGEATHSISAGYCFICDIENDKIISVYKLANYRTLDFDVFMNIDNAPMESLGREVFWLDRRFGFIGDFNSNGREELYFYRASGQGFYPQFFEFAENEFVEILEFIPKFVLMEITLVDADKKIIYFIGKGEKNEPLSYKWNLEAGRYIEMK